jgi:hypothetical protein
MTCGSDARVATVATVTGFQFYSVYALKYMAPSRGYNRELVTLVTTGGVITE